MERMVATMQSVCDEVTGNATAISTPPICAPTISVPVLSSAASNSATTTTTTVASTSMLASVQASTTVVTPPSNVQVTSLLTTVISAPAMTSAPSSTPVNNSASNLIGTEAGSGITEWYFPGDVVMMSSLLRHCHVTWRSLSMCSLMDN